jgi:acylphosphatase
MRKCLKVTVQGKVQDVSYRAFVQKHAQILGIEGTVKNVEDGSVVIYACGTSDKLDGFIDQLYKGPSAARVEDVIIEPFVNEKDFRGVFRVIG